MFDEEFFQLINNSGMATYKELKKSVDNWWNSMPEEAQHRWNVSPDPTYEMIVLGQIKESNKVRINFDKHEYEIID